MVQTFHYDLSDCIDPIAAEEDLALARFAAGCLFGQPRVRHELSVQFHDAGRSCTLEACGPAGYAVARLFTGLCTARLGDDGFTVELATAVTS